MATKLIKNKWESLEAIRGRRSPSRNTHMVSKGSAIARWHFPSGIISQESKGKLDDHN
jgi:hypothetical protein